MIQKEIPNWIKGELRDRYFNETSLRVLAHQGDVMQDTARNTEQALAANLAAAAKSREEAERRYG